MATRTSADTVSRAPQTNPPNDPNLYVGRFGAQTDDLDGADRAAARRRRVVRRTFGFLALLALGVGAVVAGAAIYRQTATPGADPSRLSGIVEANKVIIAAKASGRIARLMVDEGAWVQAGQVVAVMDSRELEAQRRQQLERIRQLSARLDQASQQVVLQVYRTTGQVSQAEAALSVVRSELAQASAELKQARTDAARTTGLGQQQLVPRQDIEQAQTRVTVAEARVASLQDRLRAAEAELTVTRANTREVRVAQGDVAQIRAEQAQAQAELAQIEARLNDISLTTPIAGMVALRVASAGEVVAAGDPTVTIVDLDHVWVRANVPESRVTEVKVGQALDVSLSSGERLQGQVIFVSPEAEFATDRDVGRVLRDVRTFAIKVAVPNTDHRVHPGMTAYVRLKARPAGTPPPVSP